MRVHVTSEDIAAIEQAAHETLPPWSTVRLFGSRLDSAQRGGDIDLLVKPPAPLTPQELEERRNRFIARLYRLLGERRIDVLVVAARRLDNRPVIQAARRDGGLLTTVSG